MSLVFSSVWLLTMATVGFCSCQRCRFLWVQGAYHIYPQERSLVTTVSSVHKVALYYCIFSVCQSCLHSKTVTTFLTLLLALAHPHTGSKIVSRHPLHTLLCSKTSPSETYYLILWWDLAWVKCLSVLVLCYRIGWEVGLVSEKLVLCC